MPNQDQILRIGFALFSVISSFCFVYYAVGILYGSAASPGLRTFAYVVGGYGLLNVYILSWAWRTRPSWAGAINLALAVCVFGAVLIDTFRAGLNSAMQLVGLLGLAAVLGINWWAVKILCRESGT